MGTFEICLYESVDNSLFDFFVKEIQYNFQASIIKKFNDGLETRYYDFNIEKYLITLHQIPMIGITIFPTNNEYLKDQDINFYNELSLFLKNRINDKI